jgi:hypothetical protein
MKLQYSVLCLALFLASGSVRAESDVSTSSEKPQAEASSLTFGVGPTLGLVNSVLGYGLGLDLLTDVTSNRSVAVGVHTGFVRWGASGSSGDLSASASITSIPILASALFRAPMDGSVHPYVGIGAGISVTNGSVSYSDSSSSDSFSATEIFFEGLVRPGLEFGSWDSQTTFFIEPKLGIIDTQFVFLPTVGANFRI